MTRDGEPRLDSDVDRGSLYHGTVNETLERDNGDTGLVVLSLTLKCARGYFYHEITSTRYMGRVNDDIVQGLRPCLRYGP